MLKNAYLDAKIGFDPAENEPRAVEMQLPAYEMQLPDADLPGLFPDALAWDAAE